MRVDGDAEIVMTGAELTVNVEEVENSVPQPVTFTLYLLLFIEAATLLRVKVVPVSPGIFVNVVPPSVLTCHWYVCPVPEDATVKVALLPAQVVVFAGWIVVDVTLLTAKIAAEEVTPVGQELPTTTL